MNKPSRRNLLASICIAPLAAALPAVEIERNPAISMTEDQQRDLLLWMFNEPSPLLSMWGLDDPLNIVEFKQLLGLPA